MHVNRALLRTGVCVKCRLDTVELVERIEHLENKERRRELVRAGTDRARAGAGWRWMARVQARALAVISPFSHVHSPAKSQPVSSYLRTGTGDAHDSGRQLSRSTHRYWHRHRHRFPQLHTHTHPRLHRHLHRHRHLNLHLPTFLIICCPALQVFHEVAYKAHHRDHLIAGLDEFLDKVGWT